MRRFWPALNEGRGAYPGDTCGPRCRSASRVTALNEGRGAYPGDTPDLGRVTDAGDLRSTKAGALTPATLHLFSPVSMRCDSAQRRPGRLPRRHCPDCAAGLALNSEIAQRRPGLTPATLGGPKSDPVTASGAQRRPGRLPRRHCAPRPRAGWGCRTRSTKAGALTPATLDIRHFCPVCSLDPLTLNEGRGAYPGDTRRRPPSHQTPWAARSTKAGALTPATPPTV